MPTHLPAHARGTTALGWLHSHHSFSFGGYQNPARTGYHGLRVLNDDRVAPGQGFPEHPHRDMEILTWVLDGTLAHKDSTGAARDLPPGTAQLMTAGTGVTHSEYNGSDSEPVHFIQIWILPRAQGLQPNYQELPVPAAERDNRFTPLATPEGRQGSLTLSADASVSAAEFTGDIPVPFTVPPNRVAYLHLATGTATVAGLNLSEGDAVTIEDPGDYAASSSENGQLLWFDLPA